MKLYITIFNSNNVADVGAHRVKELGHLESRG